MVSQLISGQKRNSVNLPCQREVHSRTGRQKNAWTWNYVHCDPLDHIALSVVIALPQTISPAISSIFSTPQSARFWKARGPGSILVRGLWQCCSISTSRACSRKGRASTGWGAVWCDCIVEWSLCCLAHISIRLASLICNCALDLAVKSPFLVTFCQNFKQITVKFSTLPGVMKWNVKCSIYLISQPQQ